MTMYSELFGNIVVPIYDIVRGTSRYRCSRILDKTQYLSFEEIKRLQTTNLRFLLNHAYETVPYYHRIFRERQLTPTDIRTVEDLEKLPILRKSDIRKNFSELISRNFDGGRLIPYSTGGTGSPLRFYITKESMSWEIAAEFRAYSWGGYKPGDSCFLLWGSRRDLKKNVARKMSAFIERRVTCDPFVLSDSVLENASRILRRISPSVIRGYATPVYVLSKYLIKNGISISPKVVITSAELLSSDMRKTISEAFQCPVFDFYGSREIGAIASECEKHTGYHISSENLVVEFIKDGEIVHSEEGQILLTNLRNYGMPLIRYQNGDVGEPSAESCTCGRELPLMKSIKGRVSQYLATRDPNTGKIVPVEASVIMDHFMTLLKTPPETYRIVQEELNRLVLYFVRGGSYSEETTVIITRELQNIFGIDTKIEVRFVDVLAPLQSGKRTPVFSTLNTFEN